MKRRTRNIIITVVVLGVIGSLTGFYLYNKGPLNVRQAKAIKINAEELYGAFNTDSSAALKNYSGKVLAVRGIVGGLSKNQQGGAIVLLKSGIDGAYINCTLEENNDVIKVEQEIIIKGICSGIGEGDADLGLAADVYLTRGYIQP